MADKIVAPKADFRDIDFGGGTLEVLRHDGQDYVAVPSMADRNLVPPNRSAKQLERFIGEGFQSHQIKRFRTSRNPPIQ